MASFSGSSEFEKRKREHILLALDPANQAVNESGKNFDTVWDTVRLQHDALPEIDLVDVILTAPFKDRILPTPFVVTGMTAGHSQANEINDRIAELCQERGWIFGVGSQRREILEHSAGLEIDHWNRLRDRHPDLVLIGNLGLSQLISLPPTVLSKLTVPFDGFAIHLNALQEALQPDGTPVFRGGILALEHAIDQIKKPLILKETGCGFSVAALEKVKKLRFHAIDISGLGGTHWGRIEGKRAESSAPLLSAAAQTFKNWGISTLESLQNAVQTFSDSDTKPEIWASGGIRSGLDAAKCLALGATRVGQAQPIMAAALKSEEALRHWMELQEFELRLALFCTGSRNLNEFRQKRGICKIVAN